MPGAACKNLNLTPPRRSPRLKHIHVVYDEDSEMNYPTLGPVKTELFDLEETVSHSTEFNASTADKDGDQDLQNLSLKDIIFLFKAKNRTAQKINSEVPGLKNQTQCGKRNFEDEVSEAVVDLDEPIIALKQKRQKTSRTKSNRKMGKPTSPNAAEPQDTPLKGEEIDPVKFSPLEVTLHDSVADKLERRATDVEHSTVAAGNAEEIVGENIFYAQMENPISSTGAQMSGGSPDILCEIKTEDMHIYFDEQVGVSSSAKDSSQHSFAELHREPIEYGGCEQQHGIIAQLTELKDVSDDSCGLANHVEAYALDGIILQNKTTDGLSSLDITNEMNNHQKPSDSITHLDGGKSSIVNDYLVSSVNQSCEDHIDINEHWYPGVLNGSTLEITESIEESYTDQCNTDVGSQSVVIQSDLCGSRKFTSLEEVVQMKADGQLDSVVHRVVGTKDILLHMDVEHATNATVPFNKTVGSVRTANFATQDGQLESIVYDALNNHAQRKSTETETFLGVPDTAMIPSPLVGEETVRDSTGAKAPHVGQILLTYATEWLSMDTNQLKATVDGDICKTVSDQGSKEEFVLQPQLLQSGADMDKTSCIASESLNPEETREMPAGPLNSTAASQNTDEQINNLQLFMDEGSLEEHAPKKLMSKRKIMSPTSQEKLCNALSGIDLCRVQRLKRKILLEDCDKMRKAFPHTVNKQYQSVLNMDRRPNDNATLSLPSKGILKSTESPSSQNITCSCMEASSALLDTEKAVEFSQRQMHDIENIAAKLIKSLKHMRSIVDESLSPETHFLLPNFNTAEIRAASEDALEVERTTRKWLTIMNKDCNRFCKILTLTGKKAVTRPEVPRKRKKITFADETGGKLCHVKVFNDGQTSPVTECHSE
ncbi:hypothetical protein GUJ93_ZPchr0003g17229 [Zizania palustris]|uniref:Uncharacterized protein n=1 Tax=Zizania palustris TaxID=103762 RepID=A0A8J5SCI8_ZIZPA|nr:hypothetical protein GUJ93_ZPchr0003g17229 [Zizania palustris]KAG8062904.1 hypothetical protein GUJ93_ZPchr0003g17229 [Zizania palustris]